MKYGIYCLQSLQNHIKTLIYTTQHGLVTLTP